MTEPVLKVQDLNVDYRNPRRQGRAVDGLSFEIAPGEALALVGESGCGKSTTALSIMKLLPPETGITGRILFGGKDIGKASQTEIEAIRGNEIGMVFQEPMTSLNPVYRVGTQIAEVLRRHLSMSRAEARARTLELLKQVALPDPERKIDAYPHELSGGQRQRVVIATAIALRPRLLIADEPTTALDAGLRGEIMELIDRLRRELGMAVLLISHDLELVTRWTDRTIVLHHGQAMEGQPSQWLFQRARHPYTRGLIGASSCSGDNRHYTTTRLTEVRATRQADNSFTFSVNTPPVPSHRLPSSVEIALDIRDLTVRYGGRVAVDGVTLAIKKGESIGLVGESGCGKSTLSRAIMGLVKPSAGTISLCGDRISGLSMSRMQSYRRRLQMVFQDPYASLNPRHSVETILGGILNANGVRSSSERHARIRTSLDEVGLSQTALPRQPHEFSGGQRQRIAIARALILRPEFVILDEPTSALDVSVQAQILNLLADIKSELGLTYLFISHDLAVINYISDRVVVMNAGKIAGRTDSQVPLYAPRQEHCGRPLKAVAERPAAPISAA